MMQSKKSANKPKLSQTSNWSFNAIGTHWRIDVYDAEASNTLKHTVTTVIDKFDRTYSRFRTDSWVARIASEAGAYAIPPDADKLLRFYRELYNATGGVVTPLIGGLLSDTGYDSEYSLQPKNIIREVPKWDDAIMQKGGKLIVKVPVLLDFGAAGKGYLVDRVADVLLASGMQQFCIDAGGDIYCHGLIEPQRIGLEHPDDESQVIGVSHVLQGAMCASAPNRRAWGEYHHILNPHTKKPAQDIRAVWVQASSTMMADGLATALFFVEPQLLLHQFQFEYAMVYADGSLRHSLNFNAELFS